MKMQKITFNIYGIWNMELILQNFFIFLEVEKFDLI